MRLPTHPLCAVAAFAVVFGPLRLAPSSPQLQETMFTDLERARLVQWWDDPERLRSEPRYSDGKTGPWAARATVDGSIWHFKYGSAVSGARKLPPTQTATAEDSGSTAGWERWLVARLARDWHRAERDAAQANASLPGAPPVPEPTPAPPAPGPIPPSLLKACGNPPSFAQAVVPLRHRVRLDNPDDEYVLTDNVKVKERFAYYRFSQGVVSYGPSLAELPQDILAKRFEKGGFTESQGRVFAAVSRSEGGFETVQTYDTGCVSVGFIQFITHKDGKHSLSAVLQRQKTDFPDAFEADFRRYGVDVQTDNTIVVVDPSTGAELVGADAVAKIGEDKRLVAVFQRAGRHSEAFQITQIRTAFERYWPGQTRFDVTGKDGVRIVGAVSDIIRSEAGMATLVDRKVNTGNLGPFAEVVARIAREKDCRDLDDLRSHERAIVLALGYREHYLAHPKLSQPAGGEQTAGADQSRRGRRAQESPRNAAAERVSDLPSHGTTGRARRGR